MKVPSSSSAEAVISLCNLSCRFGKTQALREVTLHVPEGGVYGLVGENGAGKTTLIKHVLGLMRPQAGTVRVCGRDPVRDPVEVLSKIGYLSEYRDLPQWMRVDELLRYTAAFYSTWDVGFAESLRDQFDLDPAARVRHLSQGQQAKAGLMLALAYRPEVLVLDEPSSGLDPVVRRQILETMIRSVANEGRTVFFSSHLLDEIERVSDHLALIHQGEILSSGRLETLQEAHVLLHVEFDQPRSSLLCESGVLRWTGAARSWTALCQRPVNDVIQWVGTIGGRVVGEDVPSLDEIFFGRVSKPKGKG